MSVSINNTLPAQPSQGRTEFIPLGGDGRQAPLGCYLCRLEVDGDAGAGSAVLTLTLDVRYTNLVAVIQPAVEAAAGAPEMDLVLSPDSVASTRPQFNVVGTMPQVTAATSFGDNASFLWYPPPVYFSQEGLVAFATANVGALETYKLTVEVYVFHPDVRQLTPLPFLQMNVPGVSAPASI